MSVKKLLVLGAAGLAAIGVTAAMAGGPDHMAMPSEHGFQKSVYVDLHGGAAESDWREFNSNGVIGASSDSSFIATTNRRGGWTGGVDFGYNITQHIAAEAGWFYLPRVSAKGSGSAVNGAAVQSATTSANVRSWFAYVAAKLTVPTIIVDHLDLFGKVGVAYRALKYGTSSTDATLKAVMGNGHYWAPVFGAGIQYSWENWMLGAQYMFLPSNTNVNYASTNFGAPDAAPAVNLGTVFVGYKFAV